jgi:glutaconate CoA-transferase subunit A
MTKLTSLRDAVASPIRDGDCVYAAGFTHLIPFAAGHEIIPQQRKNLVLVRATPDLIYDQMAAGAARARSSSRTPAIPAWPCSRPCAPRSKPAASNGRSTHPSA